MSEKGKVHLIVVKDGEYTLACGDINVYYLLRRTYIRSEATCKNCLKKKVSPNGSMVSLTLKKGRKKT